ncbi:hypothetical protein X798_07660 [Onchocerca flexuosa]|uniref:G_PROTEIN_RECEP_F1_2 domain-containing protein n=1 Tax=Onchocerca flexuosa TaxID=387005 RepID=A0A238BIS6_9BILA|nr:hypothetical protein X798_07660 [Onchocerca flexuosa]
MATVLFCRGKDNPYSHSFIRIASQLIISNLLDFLPQMIVVLPEILQNENSPHAFTFGDFYYCTRIFRVWNLTWEKKCETLNGKIWQSIRNLWVLSAPNIMFIIYAAIFYNTYRKKRSVEEINQNQEIGKMSAGSNTKVQPYEWSILIQAAWNCGALEVEVVLFNVLLPILTEIFGEEINILMNIILNSYVIFYCSVLPTVYLIYSKEARNIIKKHLNYLRTVHFKSKTIVIDIRNKQNSNRY